MGKLHIFYLLKEVLKNQKAFFIYITLFPLIKIYLNSICVYPLIIYLAFVSKIFIVPSKQFNVPRK